MKIPKEKEVNLEANRISMSLFSLSSSQTMRIPVFLVLCPGAPK